MAFVDITGWERGFNKVACSTTLCSVATLNLAEAKRVTDAVLEGNAQRVAVPSSEEARRLVDLLQIHGAVAHVV
jgi:hypothetical protein